LLSKNTAATNKPAPAGIGLGNRLETANSKR
jgi:hypothetical protein